YLFDVLMTPSSQEMESPGIPGRFRLPFAEVLLALTILIELGGALALILGWRVRQAALGLFLFIIPATLLFHAFWSADAASYQNQLNHFLKNLAIMGGMLYVVVFGPG